MRKHHDVATRLVHRRNIIESSDESSESESDSDSEIELVGALPVPPTSKKQLPEAVVLRQSDTRVDQTQTPSRGKAKASTSNVQPTSSLGHSSVSVVGLTSIPGGPVRASVDESVFILCVPCATPPFPFLISLFIFSK